MSEEHGYFTNLTRANTRSKSLRTTIPMAVTNHFGLKQGDQLRWRITVQDNELVVIVSPVK